MPAVVRALAGQEQLRRRARRRVGTQPPRISKHARSRASGTPDAAGRLVEREPHGRRRHGGSVAPAASPRSTRSAGRRGDVSAGAPRARPRRVASSASARSRPGTNSEIPMPARITRGADELDRAEPLAVHVPGDPGEHRLGEQDQRGAAGRDPSLAPELQGQRDRRARDPRERDREPAPSPVRWPVPWTAAAGMQSTATTAIWRLVNGNGWMRFAYAPWYTIQIANAAAQPSVRSSPLPTSSSAPVSRNSPTGRDHDPAAHRERRRAAPHERLDDRRHARRTGR